MKIEQLVITSFNYHNLGQGVQGMHKKCEIWYFFHKQNLHPEIIIFQKHHMSLEDY